LTALVFIPFFNPLRQSQGTPPPNDTIPIDPNGALVLLAILAANDDDNYPFADRGNEDGPELTALWTFHQIIKHYLTDADGNIVDAIVYIGYLIERNVEITSHDFAVFTEWVESVRLWEEEQHSFCPDFEEYGYGSDFLKVSQ
jgi:hypothetical protein